MYKPAMQNESMIYSFLDPIDYVNFEFRSRQRIDPKFTLRRWSVQLGYKNPSYLSHILKRERKLKIDVAGKIGDTFQLNSREKSYLELIVLHQNSQSSAEKVLYSKLIKKIRPKKFWDLDDLSIEKAEMVSEWYNWAILEIFYLKDFFPNIDYVYSKLGPSVSKKMVKESIEKLIELKFVERTAGGGFRRGTDNSIYMKNIPSWSIRTYHIKMIEKAKAAIENLSPSERYVRGSMIAMSVENYQASLKIMEEAHKKILELSAEDNGDHVYHFTTHLFPVTQPNKEQIQ